MSSIKPKIGTTESTAKKKKVKLPPQQRDERGEPIMIMGPSGKRRMGWMKNGKYS